MAKGKSIKEAKQKAAELAWSELRQESKEADDSFSQDQTPDSSSNTNVSQLLEERNFISKLASHCQQQKLTHTYIKVKQDGPSHNPLFYYKVVIDNKDYPEAEGKTVKEAKQKAAHLACKLIRRDLWSLDSKSDSSAGSDGSELSSRRTELSSGSSWIQFEGSPNSKSQLVSNSPDDAKEKNGRRDQPASLTHSNIHSQYDNFERLGSGAFGYVYKARNKDLDVYFAIKEIETKNQEKALQEVKALAKLDHPNIVRYFNFWFEKTGYGRSSIKSNSTFLFIQMALYDGGTLRRWIQEQNKEALGTSRRKQGLKIALQILNGVEYIHSKKLIHRDLKPANILFGQDGDVRIGDFGLVTPDNDEGEIIDRTEDRGTPNYMAPEQTGVNYDRKVDIFALGLIFFEIFWRFATGHERVASWPDVRCHNFPKEFTGTYAIESHIIKTMLSGNPEARPEASGLKTELEKWNQELTDDQGNQTV